ncbi:FAD-dependent monooxygenase [Ramlibacter sp. MMS24-I3-19]|uniref:FAD-dependent monooxygenase n=1 Tax=Ramlibacter sp. MMS24-I3-19 TaxID=3416606 RepID=UPI003CFF1852
MATVLDVCIRGAGIVGRSLALLLAAERLRVGLVDLQPAPGSDVRAYALNAASRQLLESVRAWPDEAHATPVLGMEVHGDEDGTVHFHAGQSPALAWIVDVPALEQRLAEALRFQPSVTTLTAPAEAALTIVCEGRASSTRADFGVEYDIRPYGQHAVAARLRSERPHGHVARQWFANGEVLALLPLGGQTAGEGAHDVALVWSVQQERSERLLHCDAQEFATLVSAASQQALGSLQLASERAAWPLQLARADRWTGPGWALAGDAAHTVHPLAGQGLNLGLADARTLAQVLHEREYWRGVGDPKLLRRYERARKADVLSTGAVTDGLQQLFAQDHAAWTAFRNWGMRGFEAASPLKSWVVRQAAGRL